MAKSNEIKKVFIPIDGVSRREDFPIWYEDGYEFATVHSENNWQSEKDRVQLLGSTGGQIARIKPDFRALTYDVRVDMYTYVLKTYTIFKHYFVLGMLWQMYGSISNNKSTFINENTKKNDVYIYRLEDFKGRGPCYEVRVRNLNKLRPAAASTVAMMIKEDFRGLSIGEPDPKENLLIKMKKFVLETGYTPEEIQAREAAGRNVIKPMDMTKRAPDNR
jgi:hypothetical protein